jgi:predicted nucleotidyltransferase
VADERTSATSRAGARWLRLWYPAAETAAYRLLASAAARAFGRLRFVRAVYARRSVACGEVVFGRSDIDLHLIIDAFDDPFSEGRAIATLTRRIRRLRRVVPILGDFDVSTPHDLDRWYRNRPGYWYRDRGWLRLWGDSFDRPEPLADDDELRPSLVRWFILTALRLPALVRRGSVHHSANLAIDLVHAHGLILGRITGAGRRGEVIERWWRESPADPRRRRLAAGYADAFRLGRYSELALDAQAIALELGDSIAAELGLLADTPASTCELLARSPLGFAEQRYMLPDPRSPAAVARALGELTRDPRVVVTTRGTLALLLRYWRPWEWASLASLPGSPALPEPREEDYLAAVRCSLHPEFPRAAGLDQRSATPTGLRLAQCRLYLEEGRVAVLREELAGVYQAIYGRPPGRPALSFDDYFSTDYPASVRLIAELSSHPRLR